MTRPNLTFVCELERDELQALFADPAVLTWLQTLQAGVCLGLIDHDPDRAAVVRALNQAGIPVIAWLLLPKEKGYWFNIDNAPQAAARYAEFKAWTESEKLQWQAVAIDIEPDFQELQALLAGDFESLAPVYLRRLFDPERALNGRLAYGALIRDMRADGYRVLGFQFPFIVDERKAGSTILQRVFGLVDVPVDQEGLMLYSSFSRPYSAAVLSSYAPDAGAIAVGVTGGGVNFDGPAPLSWEELSRDLRLAYRWCDDIFIFSLEGCVAQGYLERLADFDWDAALVMPTAQIDQINRLRSLLRGLLWALSHPFTSLAALVALLWLSRRLRRLF